MATKKEKLGKQGEDTACEYLKKNKFKIIERNHKKPWGEIDIIAFDPDKTLVFIEVKTMREHPKIKPEDQMTASKIKKFKKTASLYAGSHNDLIDDNKGWRLDVVSITLENGNNIRLDHYKNIS